MLSQPYHSPCVPIGDETERPAGIYLPIKPTPVALVDSDNFFVSCERLLNPNLNGQAVIVLSNNDGCVISRSPEAKVLGIKMGQPFFQLKALMRQHKVHVFSSQFAHYARTSKAVIQVLTQYSPQIEVYSIDEAFLGLEGFQSCTSNLGDYMWGARQEILTQVGVPVSIGIAPSKTLAKVAVHWAKQEQAGVLDFTEQPEQNIDFYLAHMPVGEVWGVGWRFQKRLQQLGITTALQLKQADEKLMAQRFGSVLARTQLELRGISCLPLVCQTSARKTLMFSRSFGDPVFTLEDMKQVVSTYTSRACEKLRHDHLCARGLAVSIRTSHFIANRVKHSAVGYLPQASCLTPELSQLALQLLQQIFKSGVPYRKAAVFLFHLEPDTAVQLNLFAQGMQLQQARHLKTQQVVDRLNHRYKSGLIRYASEGLSAEWRPQRHYVNTQSQDRNQQLFISESPLRFM